MYCFIAELEKNKIFIVHAYAVIERIQPEYRLHHSYSCLYCCLVAAIEYNVRWQHQHNCLTMAAENGYYRGYYHNQIFL